MKFLFQMKAHQEEHFHATSTLDLQKLLIESVIHLGLQGLAAGW